MSFPPPPHHPDNSLYGDRGYYPPPYQSPPAYPAYPAYSMPQTAPDVESAATTALVLEIVFGLFSLLGIGHVYTGRIGLGIVLLIGWWALSAIFVTVATATLGLAGCLVIPLYIAIPIISGIQARAYVKRTGSTGSWGAVAIFAGSGCLILIGLIVALALIFGIGMASLNAS